MSTEKNSNYKNLSAKSVKQITTEINNEDKLVAIAISKCLNTINKVINIAINTIENGGRIIYIGAGSSGRLGVLDAAECEPTFGANKKQILAIIAGGKKAFTKAVENAEDNTENAILDLQKTKLNNKDFLIGITASGSTPYVLSGLRFAKKLNAKNAVVTCNKNTLASKIALQTIACIVGPEYVTGSTRLKAGTAQKIILNTISTTTFIKLGKVSGNQMTFMKPVNKKLVIRSIQIIQNQLNCSSKKAEELFKKYKSIQGVLSNLQSK